MCSHQVTVRKWIRMVLHITYQQDYFHEVQLLIREHSNVLYLGMAKEIRLP